MKNYEKLTSKITLDYLLEKEVRLINVNNNQLLWITSTGQTFPYDKYNEALAYEYQYLMLDEDEFTKTVEQSKEEDNVVPFTKEDKKD